MTNVLLNTSYYKEWYLHGGLAESTRMGYKYVLKRFEKYILDSGFVGSIVDFEHFYGGDEDEDNEDLPIDKDFIDGFIAQEKNIRSRRSMYTIISALSHFFTFLKDTKLIRNNPMLLVTNPYYELKRKDRSISNDDCKKMLKAAVSIDPFSKQYAVLFLLGITCGLRANEIIKLQKSQINFERGVIFVNKGQKTKAKSVHMPTSTKNALFDYLSHPSWMEWSKGSDEKEVFFCDNSPLTYTKLHQMLSAITNKAKLERKITPHQMRHTMARIMYESGIPLSIIQRQLRHKDIKTTILYLPPSKELFEIINHLSNNFNSDPSCE